MGAKKSYPEIIHCIETKKFSLAFEKINIELSKNLNDTNLLILKAFCLTQLEKYKESNEVCKTALYYGCEPDKAYSIMGENYYFLNQFEDSEKCYLTGLKENFNNSDLISKYSELLLKTGFMEKGEKLLFLTLKKDPNNERALSLLVFNGIGRKKRGI